MDPFLRAWRAARVMPRWLIRSVCWVVAMGAWIGHGPAVRRLEDNLYRVTGLEGAQLRRLSRRGMLSTARYYSEVLEMFRVTPEIIEHRVRMIGHEQVRHCFVEGKASVAVLGHLGNWDLVGAHAVVHVSPITVVAEVLKDREVYDEFVRMRNFVGMDVLGHEGGGTFRELIRLAQTKYTLVCLLSDRDISGSGVEVQMWGRAVKVAPGPAALAHAASTWLVPVMVHYERLHGKRRRKAKSAWGTVYSFGTPLHPRDFTGPDRVAHMSQAWADQLAPFIREHAEDWHLLQRFGWVEA